MKNSLTCPCGRPAVKGTDQNCVCERCLKIEQYNAANMVRYTNHKTAEELRQRLERENGDRWQRHLAHRAGMIPPVPEGCDLFIDGYKRYYFITNPHYEAITS